MIETEKEIEKERKEIQKIKKKRKDET